VSPSRATVYKLHWWKPLNGLFGRHRRIREMREDYAARKIPTRAFAANALYLEEKP
jgi:hypothetical protein